MRFIYVTGTRSDVKQRISQVQRPDKNSGSTNPWSHLMPSLLACSAADITSVRNAVSSFEKALGDGSEWMEDTLQWLHTSVKHKGFYCNKPKRQKKFSRSKLQRDLVNNTNGNSTTCRFSYQTKSHFTCARLTRLARLPGPTSLWFLRRNFSPVSEMRKGQRSLKRALARNSRSKANVAKHKSYNFRTYHSFGNSYSCITAVKWDAYDVYNTAGNARRCYQGRQKSSRFVHVFIWQKCPALFPISRLEKPSSQEPSKPTLSYEHNENFTKDSEVKRDFGNLARSVNQAHGKRP